MRTAAGRTENATARRSIKSSQMNRQCSITPFKNPSATATGSMNEMIRRTTEERDVDVKTDRATELERTRTDDTVLLNNPDYMTSIEHLIPWEMLRRDAKDIHIGVIERWKKMLDDTSLKEPDYLKFIRQHAGLILCDNSRRFLSVAELELSTEFRPDFIIGEDAGSYGFVYHLFEMESPHDLVYTKGKNPSSNLTAALQQVSNWKRWITGNSEAAKQILPSKYFQSVGKAALTFNIIIGRREEDESWTHLRNTLADDIDVSIRSYDYLTSLLSERSFSCIPIISSAEMDTFVSVETKNDLANPFAEAYSSAAWRAIISSPKFSNKHMVANNSDLLLQRRILNPLHDVFISRWNESPAELKEFYHRGMEFMISI